MRFVESLTGRPAAPVGTHPAGDSAYGVQDMAGNVWEWVADWYDPEYYKRTGVALDPTGPMSGTARVTRGGGWTHEGRYAISSLRNPAPPGAYGPDLGFRCAMSAERPPLDSGIVLSPIDATETLVALLEAAKDNPANDDPTLDEWITTLDAIRTALRDGDNATALAMLNDRLPRLAEQRGFGFFTPRVGMQLDYALRWIQVQLTPEP
jgi:hypothetical protein